MIPLEPQGEQAEQCENSFTPMSGAQTEKGYPLNDIRGQHIYQLKKILKGLNIWNEEVKS